MSGVAKSTPLGKPDESALLGQALASPAGPISVEEAGQRGAPPVIRQHPALQMLRFNRRQIEFVFRARRLFGDVFGMRSTFSQGLVITSHPDHVRSLFTADPAEAPSLTRDSPLRPIVGPGSVLTAVGPRHMHQRKLLLPHFHGEAVERYRQAIADAATREIDSWPLRRPFSLAPRMQAITLDVIMAGIFGIRERPRPDTAEGALRSAIKEFLAGSVRPMAQMAELISLARRETVGPMRRGLELLDRQVYATISRRRRDVALEVRSDILSLLLCSKTDDGEGMSNCEVRDELIALILAGHETTANSLAWIWERLVRNREAHDRLRETIRADEDAERVIEATIVEGMRCRPVIPVIGRQVKVPWRLGAYEVEANARVLMSILLIHHREDLYPRPFEFKPERWIDRQPGTYNWIPFGGGIRRCLGASLAMAEQRVVLEAMSRRLDLEAADPEPERALHRNVTMIPTRGSRVVVRSRAA